MNSKQALDHIKHMADWEYYDIKGDILPIEKDLEILEIIKNKCVNINTLIDCMLMVIDPLKFYNEKVSERLKLTQQEFDLLKEVLEDE